MSKLKDPNDSLRPCRDGGVVCKNVGNGSKSTQCFSSLCPLNQFYICLVKFILKKISSCKNVDETCITRPFYIHCCTKHCSPRWQTMIPGYDSSSKNH